MTLGGTFDEMAIDRADRHHLYPVSAGEDILASIEAVTSSMDEVLKQNVAQPPSSEALEAKLAAALRSQEFVETVKALDRLLDLALGQIQVAKRDDVVIARVDVGDAPVALSLVRGSSMEW